MLVKTVRKSIIALSVTALLALNLGCGGGGGGGGTTGPITDVNPTSVEAPNTLNTLNTVAAAYTYSSTAANVAVKIPVNNESVRFALTVTNSGNTSQQVKISPESYISGLPAVSMRENVRTSVVDELDEIRVRQMAIQAKFRQQFVASMNKNAGNLRSSLSVRAANNSGEVLGSEVALRIIADGSGSTYQTINCKLMKITDHCKIFVDQGTNGGLSAISGTYAITAEDLNHFATEFETHIHNLLTQSYGPVYDIDQDTKLSIVFSPVYANLGFAGLFNSLDLTPLASMKEDKAVNSNQRDLIALWSPNGSWIGEKWREATRETIAHEMQHIVNMSAKVYPSGVLRVPAPASNNYDLWLETMWLDESLAVGVEARYRVLRGSPARENRFDRWASNPYLVRMDDFSYSTFGYAFEHYGQKGLFNFYLFEKYGAEKIKQLVQTTNSGVSNLETVYGIAFSTLVKNWSLAVLNESLRYRGFTSVGDINSLFRYETSVSLNIAAKEVSFGQGTTDLTIGANATAYYVISQPANFASSEYRFRVTSTEGQPIEIMMMRLPNP